MAGPHDMKTASTFATGKQGGRGRRSGGEGR